MQTLEVQVQDGFVEKFMNYIQNQGENITITKNKNLELDPYFYERQKKLHKLREDVHNGSMKLFSQEESDHEIELFFQKLENNQ